MYIFKNLVNMTNFIVMLFAVGIVNSAAASARSLHFDFTLAGPAVPTSDDPCVLNVLETGTVSSEQLGDFKAVGHGVDSMCTRGIGKGDAVALFVFTDKNGNTILATYHTIVTVPDVRTSPTVLTWQGTWKFVGGTGKYANIRGSGTVPKSPLQDVSKTYKCEFDGEYSL
jgi:hypothetical protein